MARAVLDRETVLTHALSLIDEGGPERLTVRGLAKRLGTFPNVVYWHVGNREQLLAQVVDHAFTELRLPEPTEAAALDWLERGAREIRRVMHAHPGIAPVVGSRLLVSTTGLGGIEALVRVFAELGFSGSMLAHVYNAFVGSVLGWVCMELCRPPECGPDWRATFRADLTALDVTRYPSVAAHLDVLADKVIGLRTCGGQDQPLDESFEVALRMWLRGIEAL